MEENTHICSDCGEPITQEPNEIYERGETREICNDCMEHYVVCNDCGDHVYETDYIYSDLTDACYCQSCYDERFTRCNECDCELEIENSRQDDNGNYYCDDCYYERFATCRNCGNDYERDEMHYDDDTDEYYCDDCYDELSEQEDEYVIKSYHNRDIPITYKYLESELKDGITKNDLLYFGTETEVENKRNLISNNDMARKIRHELRDMQFVFETDGSLNNGFEIISQPMTMAYIKEHKEDLEKMFKMLSENGFASHDTSTCGLHIHFSRNYFADNEDKYLQKLTLFFETFKNELQAFSRRGNFRWCQFVSDASCGIDRRYLKSSVILKDFVKDHPSHNIAINTGNTNTIEIRIFKGTLKFETYMASLELVNNLVKSIKNKNTRKISFDNVVNSYETDYIKDYCNEKHIYNSAYLNDETKNVFTELETKRQNNNKSIELCKSEYKNLLNTILMEQKDIMNRIESINDLDGRIRVLSSIYELLRDKSSILRNDNGDFTIDNESIETGYKKYLSNSTNNRALRYYEDLIDCLYYALPNQSNECYESLRTIYDNAKENLEEIKQQLNNNTIVEGEQ